MNRRILMVDDDERILAAYQRSLRLAFDLDVAQGGQEGLDKIEASEPFAVVVADMQMPGMNGVRFLEQVQEVSPDSVRMMLTGNADQRTAVEAVNKGHIFRFMNKPCPVPDMTRSLEAGLEQYRLVTAERELLDQTLAGVAKVLTEVLSYADPMAFDRAQGVLDYSLTVSRMLGSGEIWALRLASMLAQIGRVTVPTALLDKAALGRPLTTSEKGLLVRLPEIGARLLENIPRLKEVAQIVRYQRKGYDGSGFPPDTVHGEDIPIGARILACVQDYLELERQMGAYQLALEAIEARAGRYDPKVLKALRELMGPGETSGPEPRAVEVEALEEGMVLAQDVVTHSGLHLFSKGNRLGASHIVKIHNFARLFGLPPTILVVDTRT